MAKYLKDITKVELMSQLNTTTMLMREDLEGLSEDMLGHYIALLSLDRDRLAALDPGWQDRVVALAIIELLREALRRRELLELEEQMGG